MTSWLLRRLHWLQVWFHFDLQLEWVASEDNVAADAASREDWDRFFMAVTGRDFITDSSLVQVSDQMQSTRRSWSLELCNIAQFVRDMQ